MHVTLIDDFIPFATVFNALFIPSPPPPPLPPVYGDHDGIMVLWCPDRLE